ncbi:G2/mitotic-specific cyclin-B1 [Morus bassanus]
MASRATWQTRTAADGAEKSSLLPTAKSGAVAAAPRTRSRTALGDIGNRVVAPKTRPVIRTVAVAMEVSCGAEPDTRPVPVAAPEKMDAVKKTKAVVKEGLLQPILEPCKLEPQSPDPMEVCGFATSETMLCQAFSDVLLDVEDVDAEDSGDLRLCSDYVKDIYKYLRELEENQPIRPEYLTSREVNGNMRAILMDWLVQVQIKFRLQQETLYMSVAITDRFLQDNAVSERMLQLVGVTAIFIASKYEEVYAPHIGEFANLTDNTYTTVQICQMEVKILQALNFSLSRPLPPHFLRRGSKVAEVDFEQHALAKYLMELSIIDYEMVHILPSKTAAAAFCLALKLLNGCAWTPTLQHYMFHTESDLLPVMQHLAKNVILVNKGITKLLAVTQLRPPQGRAGPAAWRPSAETPIRKRRPRIGRKQPGLMASPAPSGRSNRRPRC